MTVDENMAFGLRLRGASKSRDRARRVRRAAEILGLAAAARPQARASSRAASASAWPWAAPSCASPRSSCSTSRSRNLDAKLRVQMRAEIKALHQRLGTTMIYVTHDQIEAMTMADRIVVLQDGNVEQVGPPLELYDRPANLFVAGFIGSPADEFRRGHPGAHREGLARGGGRCLPAAGPGAPGPEGRKVVFGIRPEHLGVGPVDAGVPAEVEVIEPTGASTYVFTRIAGAPVTAIFTDRRKIAPGERIGLVPQPDRIHLFDAATGQRLETMQ